jgi:hypothetical protein
MKVQNRSFTLVASVVFSLLPALGQLTVDATGPIREMRRTASIGGGGSVGRKVPLQVAMKTTGAPPDEDGKTVVEFNLTNSGKTDLIIPISPHPGDLEPANPNASYSLRVLGLFVTSDKKQAKVLQGGANLYGSDILTGTQISVAPGESIRVIGRVALPRTPATEKEGPVFVGHASLNNLTFKVMNGKTVFDMQQIGSSSSPEYTAQTLLQ